MSKPARCVCAAVITTVLLTASGCGSNNDAEVPGDASPDASPEEPIDEPAAAPSAESDDPSPAKQRRRLLDEIEHWLYLIDVNLEGETVDEIVESNHDMVVLDFIPSEQQNTDYHIGEVIELLHETDHRKLVLAYIDIGQAEDYRVYWEEDWQIGDPDWIVADDPDGWEGNYPVAYWRQEWHDIWLGEDGFVSQIVDAGFDGIYLDWVEAYSDDNVATAGSRDDIDPIEEMVNWVAALAQTGRDGKPEFLVIAQNAAELATENGGYRAVIDALAQEQVWFDGAADNDPPGDCPLPATDELVDTEGYETSLSEVCLQQYLEFPDSTLHVSSEDYLVSLDALRAGGLPILTIDYATEAANVQFVLETSRSRGFLPFVSTRLLDEYVPPR